MVPGSAVECPRASQERCGLLWGGFVSSRARHRERGGAFLVRRRCAPRMATAARAGGPGGVAAAAAVGTKGAVSAPPILLPFALHCRHRYHGRPPLAAAGFGGISRPCFFALDAAQNHFQYSKSSDGACGGGLGVYGRLRGVARNLARAAAPGPMNLLIFIL